MKTTVSLLEVLHKLQLSLCFAFIFQGIAAQTSFTILNYFSVRNCSFDQGARIL